MPSPFPGMNPYLEQPSMWMDFHQSMAIYIRGELVRLVGPRYYVRIEQRLYLSEWPEEDPKRFFGSADISMNRPRREQRPVDGNTLTLESPLRVVVDIPEAKRGLNLVEIVDRQSNEIVTVIEILSPSNKYPGDDRAAYLEKRAEIWRSNANLVELDLLRGGPKLPSRGMSKCDYHIFVSRPEDRPEANVWPFGLRDPIPPFPVPLRTDDSPVQLSLKPLIDRLYDEANYGQTLYHQPPVPPLTPEDQAWAEGILQSVVPA